MRIIYLQLIVCLGLATAKYLPNESASLIQLSRHLRSIEDDSAVINENKSDEDSDEDISDERSIAEQLQKIEEERQELSQKPEEQESKQKEEELKQQEKIVKEERKRQEKIEKEERKRQEKQEKEERKRQEKNEKENRKQEEADRKHREKIEKEERKRLEKLQKQQGEIEKDSFESNKIPSDSSESLETNESNESLDLEDIWRNHIYAKYGLSVNSTDLERKVVLNKYLEEELGLNVNSTKSERRLAVIKLMQNNLNKDGAYQDALRNYILTSINVMAIQQIQGKLEHKVAKLNNESLLLENGTMPWVTEEKQTIDEKRTLIQSVLQFFSHLLPNWANNGQIPSNINSNTTAISQGVSGSSVSNVNVISSNISGAASSGTPELAQGSASGSVDVNSESNTVVESSTDASQTGGAISGAEGSSTSIDVSSISTATGGSVATSSVDITSSGNNESGASVSTASNIDSTVDFSSPTEILSGTGNTGSSTDQQSTDPINSSTGGFSPSSDNSEITIPASSINAQESVSSANSPTVSSISPSEGLVIPESVDNSVVIGIQDSVPANKSTQESTVPLGEAVPTTGSVNVPTTGIEAPATSSIDGSLNAVSTSGDSAAVTGSNSFTQESSIPSDEAVNVPTTDIETPAISSIDGSSNAVSTPGDSATVNGPTVSTQEISVPFGEAVSTTGSVNVSTSDLEVPVTSSIDGSSNIVSTSGDSDAVTESSRSIHESSVPSGEAVPIIGSVNLAGFDVEAPATSYIGGSLNGISTSGDSTAVIRPIETESSSAQESTTGVNDLTLAGAKPPAPVDVSSTGIIAPENPTIDIVDASSTNANLPPGTTDNFIASSTVENIDIALADIEQATAGSIDVTQINSETNSTVVPAAGPTDITANGEVLAIDVPNVVTTIITSSADVLPSTNSPNIEVAREIGVVIENSNVNATDAASVSTNISNSPDATTIIVPSDVLTDFNIAASSISGVSESTKVDIAPTSSPNVIATDVTNEVVTVDNSVALAEQASVAPEVNRVPEDGSSILSLPNEPGASVIEITLQ